MILTRLGLEFTKFPPSAAETPTRRTVAHGHVISRRCQSRIHSPYFRNPRIKKKDVYTDIHFFLPFYYEGKLLFLFPFFFLFFSRLLFSFDGFRVFWTGAWMNFDAPRKTEWIRRDWMNEQASSLLSIVSHFCQTFLSAGEWRTIQIYIKKKE